MIEKKRPGRPRTGGERVSVYLPQGLLEGINSDAQRRLLTRNEIIRLAVSEYVIRLQVDTTV